MLEGWGVQSRGEIKGENWENSNSIINKISLKIKIIKNKGRHTHLCPLAHREENGKHSFNLATSHKEPQPITVSGPRGVSSALCRLQAWSNMQNSPTHSLLTGF